MHALIEDPLSLEVKQIEIILAVTGEEKGWKKSNMASRAGQ